MYWYSEKTYILDVVNWTSWYRQDHGHFFVISMVVSKLLVIVGRSEPWNPDAARTMMFSHRLV
jgi:hypothetical protein